MKLPRTQLIPIITDILNSCIELEKAGVSATGPNKILRETLHFIWEVSDIKKYDDKIKVRKNSSRDILASLRLSILKPN